MKTFMRVVFSATLCLIAIAFFSSPTVRGQREQMTFAQWTKMHPPNYDESKVPSYTLPDPLVTSGGERVVDARTWIGKRQPEILKLFETHVYGRSPGRPPHLKFEVTSTDPNALGGKAVRKQVSILFAGGKGPSEGGTSRLLPQRRTKTRAGLPWIELLWEPHHPFRSGDHSFETVDARE